MENGNQLVGKKPISKLAIASFVLSLPAISWLFMLFRFIENLVPGTTIFILLILNPLSFILGVIALTGIKKYRLSSMTFAIIGIVASFIIELLMWVGQNGG